MRIWDLEPKKLCRNHLLGEHRELHAIWTILTEGKKGYASHPETLRWKGRLAALYARHRLLTVEMQRRGYCHRSELDRARARGARRQTVFLCTPRQQAALLRKKHCACRV